MCTQVLFLHRLHHQFTKSTIIFTVSSLFLLAVMAYDRFVAISNPLSYNVVMSPDICMGLLAGAYICGLSKAILRTVCAFTLSFCDDDQINFFFCHLPPLLKLASHSMTQSETVILFPAKRMFLASGTIILVSYTLIIRTLRFWEWSLLVGKPRPSPPAPPISLLLFSSLGHLPSRAREVTQTKPQEESKIVSFTLWSSLCWTLWPTVWGTKTQKVQSEKSVVKFSSQWMQFR